MNNKILITQFALGPTYKERLLKNITTYKSYDYFDIFLLTDSVEYFDSISHKSNVIIKDIDEMRKSYPWSFDLEPLPKEKFDEVKYAEEFLLNNTQIPTLLRRFVFNWERVSEYDGFIFMDCDIIPTATDEVFQKLNHYFTTPFPDESLQNKIIVIPAGYYDDENTISFLKEFATTINNKYKITDSEIKDQFIRTDGNFRSLKFPNKESIKIFSTLLDNIIYDILTDDQFFILKGHTMWRLHSEHILSIIFNLLGAESMSWSPELGLSNSLSEGSFRVDCYPEDRFWNWALNTVFPSQIGKQDFIDKNYDELKKFYENRAQIFPY